MSREAGPVERTIMVPSKQVRPGVRIAPLGERPTSPGSPASPPPGTGRAWKPFAFTRLEKVSQAQARLVDHLDWLVPAASGTGRVEQAVVDRLEQLFEADCELIIDSVHVLSPGELRRFVVEPTFLATLAPLPHKTRGFMEIELGLAHAAIDLLLGGAGEAVALRPLTDIEEGVMSFVVLEVLKVLSPDITPGLPRLRMEGLAHGVDQAVALLGDEPLLAQVQFKCVLGAHSGYVRLFIPSSVLAQASPADQAEVSRARLRARIDRHLGRLDGVKTWLRAGVGHAEIGSSDLVGLSKGDVVLADEITVRSDLGQGGGAQLRVGMGRTGRMDAEVFLEGGRYRAKIKGFTCGEDVGPLSDEDNTNPSGSRAMPGERNSVEESTLKEGSELLNDIPLQVAIELARVPVTAEQVVSLRVGQVIDLNRVPGEPVELSVNGKTVARGELVEVEGHLGVRILSMAG